MLPRPFFLVFLGFAGVVFAVPHRYDHVVVVIEENRDRGQVIGNRVDASFINELADAGVNFTEFYGITHPSQPNYLHLFAGDNQGVVDDNKPATYPWTTPNLGAALIAAGATFSGYSEDLPSIGDRDSTGVDVVINAATYKLYRRKHNPWANWQAAIGAALGANQLAPETNRRFLDFPADYALLPKVAFVVPNEQNDMHDGTIRMADDWLRANLAAYAQWAPAHNSLLVVTFDEDGYSGPNRIPTILVGAGITPGSVNATRWTLHNLLRTLEDMHGAAHSARSAQVRPIAGVFPGDPPVLAARFRQGLNGYAGCVDTTPGMAVATADQSAATMLIADLDTDSVAAGNQPSQILVRFGNLFGAAAGQVPGNATIVSAKLSLWTGAVANDNSTALASIHRMKIAWNDTATWNSLVNGVSTDDIEAALAASFTQSPALLNAPVIFDVTADIAAFAAGTPNQGWVINDTGTDGWYAASSENATVTSRPTLEIAYTIPVAAGYLAWQLAKFGTGAGSPGSLVGDDPDGDSTVNLLEYALNANPLRSSTGEQPSVAGGSGTLTVAFTRNTDATDITLRVEATRNLTNAPWSPVAAWTPGTGWSAIPGVAVSDIAGAVNIVESTAAPRFYRIAVTRP